MRQDRRRNWIALAWAAALLATSPTHAEPRALITIGPIGGDLNASTYTTGSFEVENLSDQGETITSIRLDLSTSLLPDLVFDPFGVAGDVVAKDLQPNGGTVATGFLSHEFALPHDGGFDAVDLTFDDFDPSESFKFSVDVDPTSIRGAAAPGPNESGSVSGLELSGATIEITFDGGPTLSAQTFMVPGSLSASEVEVAATRPSTPALEILDVTPPATVGFAPQIARVTGTPSAVVELRVVEAGLFVAGVPGGGFDLDPFEANSAVSITEHLAVLDGTGQADIAIQLGASSPEAGLNFVSAAELDGGGLRSDPTQQVVHYLPAISFLKGTLELATPTRPTSLQFGPDGRLYVSQQNGTIRIYTIVRDGPGEYRVTDTETLTQIRNIPNHDDDGSLSTQNNRQVTGLLVVGTADEPVVYVGSSDPRIGGGGSGTETGLDTNSGVLSRLTWNGASWDVVHLVRGLPRSEENHAINGLALDTASNTLFAPIGGSTNMGAPSNNFALTPEYALSAAILSFDLDAIGDSTYDLPTLDDEDHPGADPNDPFGGNDGKNQAILQPGGPVQVYAPGFRNAYDVVQTEAGHLFAIDNGSNAGWGDAPIDNGGTCTNDVREPGVTHSDGLHRITGPGYYAGHPNPTRADPANTFNDTDPQSPVSVANPVECEHRIPGAENGALALFGSSTNGLTEYRSDQFLSQMRGDLLAASFDNTIYRIALDASGTGVESVEALFSSVGIVPLDVTAQSDSEVFPGTIWVTDLFANAIVAYEPIPAGSCTGAAQTGLDEDGDGYDNQDEIDNGTNPCSPADFPPDHDGDFVSDLNDPDDDNDGIADVTDLFVLDPFDGAQTTGPVAFTWDNNAPPAGGMLGLGFTGCMSNGVDDYLFLFDLENMTPGGAAGVLSVDAVPPGDARAAQNDQEYGFHFGWTHSDAPFVAGTQLLAPFSGVVPTGDENFGLFVGTGDQDNYLKLVVSKDAVSLALEVDGAFSEIASAPLGVADPDSVDLYLELDPATHEGRGRFVVTEGGQQEAEVPVGAPTALPEAWFDAPVAVGILSTSANGTPYPASWNHLTVPEPSLAWFGLSALTTLALLGHTKRRRHGRR